MPGPYQAGLASLDHVLYVPGLVMNVPWTILHAMIEPTCIPLPTPYPVGRINAYVLPGEAPALIDTGVLSDRSLDELGRGLAERDLVFEDLGFLLLTHNHQDHCGAAAWISREHRVPVLCHADALVDEERGRLTFLELLERYGAPEETVEEITGAWKRGAGFGDPLSSIAELDLVNDGDFIGAGDLKLEVLHTPGHGPGHLCFLDSEHDLLFCGDLLLGMITSNPLPHFDPDEPKGRRLTLGLYLESLELIESLGPLKGYPGHGLLLPDTAERARQVTAHIEERSADLTRLIAGHPGMRVFDVAQRHFHEPTAVGQALAFCEVLAHCDLLEDRGLVVIDPANGAVEATSRDFPPTLGG